MEKLYTIKEACGMLRLSRATAHRLLKKGILKAIKIGGKVLFKETDLNELISKSSYIVEPHIMCVAEGTAQYEGVASKNPQQVKSRKSKNTENTGKKKSSQEKPTRRNK